MTRTLFIIVVLLVTALPSALYAVGMGGGMAGMISEIAIQTKDVGKIVFSHNIHGTNCNACHPKIFKKKANSNHVGMKAMEQGKSCGACHNGKTAFSVTGDCTTCHAGDIQYQTKTVGKVLFSHDAHVDMFGCRECHPDQFKPQKGSNPATMKQMEEGASCGACHDGGTAFGVADDCTTCHAGDILYEDEDAGNVVFPHSAHIDMFGCDECHPDLYIAERGKNEALTMMDMENGESCGACHDGSTAFGVAEDCESCHEM